jgi:3-oxoacyl-[acyl-carrier protein] reductase
LVIVGGLRVTFEKRVALVTGASRGIGAAISDNLGLSGHSVVGTATTQRGADKITARFAEKNIDGSGMVLDVTDSASIENLIKKMVAACGAPMILVNNAGITKDNLLLRMQDDEWTDVIDTNLNAIFRLTKACLRPMTKSRWGRIINISSVVGSMGNAGQSNYSATKAGVAGFSRSLAREMGSRGITVNTIAPGCISTDMTKDLAESDRQAMLSQIPLARLGSPSEIAAVVDFLASESAGYITGETIHVNGGMYMAG